MLKQRFSIVFTYEYDSWYISEEGTYLIIFLNNVNLLI